MGFEIGKTVEGYEIVELLGTSKTGVAYKVRNVFAQRFEVMKILPKNIQDDAEQNARFLREIKLHAQLLHPNIVTFYNAREIEGQLVMTKEFVPGVKLSDKLKAGALDWREACKYAGDGLSALEYAHAHGIIHRGLSSSNLIITAEGVARLKGFGFAKSASDPELTAAGVVIGALKYMAPEQVKGEAIDVRCDLYSLGIVLYEMLTGKVPFDAKGQFEIMMAQVATTPKHVSDLNSAVPRELGDLVAKALAKPTDGRFQTALEFHDAVRQVISARNSVASPAAGVSEAPATVPGRSPAVDPPITPVPLKDAWTLGSALELAESQLAAVEQKGRPSPDASLPAEPLTAPDSSKLAPSQPVETVEKPAASWTPVDWSGINALMESFGSEPSEPAMIPAAEPLTSTLWQRPVAIGDSSNGHGVIHESVVDNPATQSIVADTQTLVQRYEFPTALAVESDRPAPLLTALWSPAEVKPVVDRRAVESPASVTLPPQDSVDAVSLATSSPAAIAETSDPKETAAASESMASPQTPVDWLALTAQLAALGAGPLPSAESTTEPVTVSEPAVSLPEASTDVQKPVDWLALTAQLAAIDSQMATALPAEPKLPPADVDSFSTAPETPSNSSNNWWSPEPAKPETEPTQLDLLSAALDSPKPPVEEAAATDYVGSPSISLQQDLWAAQPIAGAFDSHSPSPDFSVPSVFSESDHVASAHDQTIPEPVSLWTSGPPETWVSEPATPTAAMPDPAVFTPPPPPVLAEPVLEPVLALNESAPPLPSPQEATALESAPSSNEFPPSVESSAIPATPAVPPSAAAPVAVAARRPQAQPDLLTALFGDTLFSRVSLVIVICAITFFLGTVALFAVLSVSKP